MAGTAKLLGAHAGSLPPPGRVGPVRLAVFGFTAVNTE
jgi:hypothetical protein